MHYKVVLPLSSRVPAFSDREGWRAFLDLQGKTQVTDFCSLASNFVEDLLGVVQPDDMDEVDYISSQRLFLINNLAFAKKLAAQHPGSRIYGVVFDPAPASFVTTPDLLGFDILDLYANYSLLEDMRWLDQHYGQAQLNQFGLLQQLERAIEIKTLLRHHFGDSDWHARNCEVWAVFRIRDMAI